MLKDILFALWFFLPAGIANAAPVFANKIPNSDWLAKPMDFGKHLRQRRIFQSDRTGMFLQRHTKCFKARAHCFCLTQGARASLFCARVPRSGHPSRA